MRGTLAAGLTLLTLTTLAAPADAFGHRRRGCNDGCAPVCAPPPPPQVQWVEKKVTCYRPEWREREVPCVINRVIPHEEVVPVKRMRMVPEWRDVKQTITVMQPVPREVVQNVTCCRMVPTCVTDPCTGCTRTVCKPETYVQQVKRVVMQCVPRQQEITTRMCSYKPVEETVQCRRIVCEVRKENVTRKERYCVMVPFQTTVKVPVCVNPNPCQ
jgi:hypothetical protein